MKFIRYFKYFMFLIGLGWTSCSFAQNQTPDVSPIFPEDNLPFRVRIELADFSLPNGLQSFDFAVHDGKWLLLNGRTNGLHGFNNNPNNFPPQQQNTVLYVVDPKQKKVWSRSLLDPSSGLTLAQIESLSVTSAQSYQVDSTLYVVGGYGFDSTINNFTTKDTLTAIDVPGLIEWVIHSSSRRKAVDSIRQITNPLFRITGGHMDQISKKNPTLLMLGQDFEGTYFFGVHFQNYSRQIRRFRILDDGKHLGVDVEPSLPSLPDPNYRRRDLNIVRVIREVKGRLVQGFVALSGVFTEQGGAWTVPINISAKGQSSMPDPFNLLTFKQGMNNYVCPTLGLFSKSSGDMFTVLFGGISYGFFNNGVFQTDDELPFINQVTTIQIDKKGHFSQYLMSAEYPVILSTSSNFGNQLLFGAGALFIFADRAPHFEGGIIKLDKIKESTFVGYIVGGIESTLPNTSSTSDSAASPYIFKVFIDPVHEHSHSHCH